MATIGAAGQFCPNIKRNAEPLFGNLAAAWQGFRMAEMQCDLWKSTYGEAEGKAGLQIAKNGLKSFCETSVHLYGPSGSLVKNGLIFDTVSP